MKFLNTSFIIRKFKSILESAAVLLGFGYSFDSTFYDNRGNSSPLIGYFFVNMPTDT